MASADTLEGPPTKRKLHFMDLPREVQKDIFSHCPQSDLIGLALVSRHFHELAAAQLYRNFHIVFPDEDDPAFDSPIDGLAGGLDTFVTSDYDYAKHLRDLSLDTLSAGIKAEAAYKPYLYNVSCGKFMNTLMLLTLRKATSLESFRWNIRVELSRPVYKALHGIDTLRQVHIRLQSGPSLFEAPPPLPFISVASSASSSSTHLPEPLSLPPPPLPFTIPGPPSAFYVAPSMSHPPPPPKPISRAKTHKKTNLAKEPPTISGFKNLKSLSVLDIDSLDIVTELKTCVRNSSATLTKLKLSFSDSLGLQARKPPPDLDPDDSDPEDEFQVVPVPTPGNGYNDDVSGPARAFRAQEERKSQEAVLGRIFDVEPYMVKKPQKKSRETEKVPKEEPQADPGRDFINAIKAVSNKLMKELNGTGDFSLAQQDILDIIETAAKKYVASEEGKTKEVKKDDVSGEGPSSSNSEPKEKEKEPAKEPEKLPEEPSNEVEPPSASIFGKKAPKAKDGQNDADPEDINIEEPEELLAVELQDTHSKTPPNESNVPAAEPSSSQAASQADNQTGKQTDTQTDNQTDVQTDSPAALPAAPETTPRETVVLENGTVLPPGVLKAMGNLAAQKVNFSTLTNKLGIFEVQANELIKEIQQLRNPDAPLDMESLEDAEKRMQDCSSNIQDIQKEMNVVESEIADAQKQIMAVVPPPDDPEGQARRIRDYLRSTRGLALQSLAIYLIPVKASVLSRAVDLRVLKRLTLLNVGSQAPIWAHLHKENKEFPLPLRKIHTDNVSMAFLTFASQLEELHDLFMLERDHKYKPESFAPRTTTTIDQIRRLILKKHTRTLKRLMVKNMTDLSWDFDEKTTLLVCRRAQPLEELSCNMGIKAIHTFMQNISGLANLRALHIIQLRNDDTCVWVMRETKRFLIDNLAHHPEMKLEWISIDDDDRVERILRSADIPKREKKSKKAKGKQKAANANNNPFNDMFPVLPAVETWDMSSDSDSDDDDGDGPGLKLETLEGIHFYDVWGVRIFKKEIIWGRL